MKTIFTDDRVGVQVKSYDSLTHAIRDKEIFGVAICIEEIDRGPVTVKLDDGIIVVFRREQITSYGDSLSRV